MLYDFAPSCLCVLPVPYAQQDAVQRLLRPHEVADLIGPPPTAPRTLWNRNDTFPSRVADFMRSHLRAGSLRYIPDPVDCDRWCAPAETRRRGGGDCDDLAIFVASLLHAGGDDTAHVVIGTVCSHAGCTGHAWVEGQDELGGYLLEATSGALHRTCRPHGYKAKLAVGRYNAVMINA